MKTTSEVSNNMQKWAMINYLLNILRQAKGIPLVSADSNPYLVKNRMKDEREGGKVEIHQ